MGLLGVSVWVLSQSFMVSKSYERDELEREYEARQLRGAIEESDRLASVTPYANRFSQLKSPNAPDSNDQFQRRLDSLNSQIDQLREDSRPKETVGTILSNNLINILPRLTILIFIEVLAGFFLRQYRIGVEDLKYFLDLERKAKARSIAYSIYNQFDTAAKMSFAAAILSETSQMILKEGETTTTVKVMENERNAFLEALETVSKHVSNISEVVKKPMRL